MYPDEVKAPKSPDDWVDPSPNTSKGGLHLKKWKTQVDVGASTTALYLCLDHKASNTRPIVSQMDTNQLRQMNRTLQYVHMEGGFFSTKGVIRGEMMMR